MRLFLLLALAVPVYAQSWTALSGTTFDAALCPPDGASGSVNSVGSPYPYRSSGGEGANKNCSGAVQAWTGGVARTKAGSEELYFLGQGGHGDYGGNEIYTLNLHAAPPTFTRISNPSTLLASYYTDCDRSYPDGKPASRHVYDQLAYIPTLDKFYMHGGSVYCGNGTNYRDGWLYDPSTGNWTEVIPATGGSCINPRTGGYSTGPDGRVTYNPNDGQVYIGQNTWFYKVDLATSCYTIVSQTSIDAWKLKAIMDTARNRIVNIGGDLAYTMSVTGTYADVRGSIGAACVPVVSSDGPGGFYDSANDVYVLYPQTGGNTLYKLNPTDWSCTTVTTTGAPTGNPVTGLWGRFSYFPTLGKIAVLADFGQQWYTADYGAAPAPTTTNTLTIKNEGATTTNYPVQIGRAFAAGEIPSGQLPQAWVGSTAVSTQVDVKSRWSDNSLKHAIISFLIPSFTGGATETITLYPGTTAGNTALTQAQMLAAGYNFDAVISLTNGGTTRTASARTMLTNGDYTVWASGPIATTILLGHHAQGFACPAGTASGAGAVASKYDFGMNTRCAFRPLFEATFWATTNQVRVRFVGEVANTEQFEDVATTAMLLTAGNTSPATVYSRATALTMNAATRWTKTAWIGGTPATISTNHNLAYLTTTKTLPNFDTSKTVSGGDISTAYTAWTGAAKDLYERGQWDNATSGGFGGGGAHAYVGPYPAWVVQYLYAGDYRLLEQASGNAELLGAMEWHYREGNSTKKIDRAGAVGGVGYPISVSTRPTLTLNDLSVGNAEDRVIPVGTATVGVAEWDSNGWGNIVSHQPEVYYPLYLVTGDHFFLEEGMFQASYMAGWYSTDMTTWRSRGPTGREGAIGDSASRLWHVRGQAWAFRNRVETASAIPDGHAVKAYLETLIPESIAYWEGQRGVTGTSYQGNTMYNFGVSTNSGGSPSMWDACEWGNECPQTAPSPLHFWQSGNLATCDDRLTANPAQVKSCSSPWMEAYVTYALGRGKELGYATDGLLAWHAVNWTGALTDPGYNPYLAAAYRSTIVDENGQYFTTWAEAKTGYCSAVAGACLHNTQGATSFDDVQIWGGALTDSNANVQPILTAVSMVADRTNGSAAWSWVNTNILPSISGDPKWAILPRSVSSGSSSGSRFSGTFRGAVR